MGEREREGMGIRIQASAHNGMLRGKGSLACEGRGSNSQEIPEGEGERSLHGSQWEELERGRERKRKGKGWRKSNEISLFFLFNVASKYGMN